MKAKEAATLASLKRAKSSLDIGNMLLLIALLTLLNCSWLLGTVTLCLSTYEIF